MTNFIKHNEDVDKEIIARINELKKQKGAVILAHLYQWPQIQDIADFVGDSLELSKKAKTTESNTIVFCGVYFMAETAKIISPQKEVLLPELHAGCPMADMITPDDIDKLRAQNPNAAVVCYVNSSAAVKAKSDICCTSSNAVKVIQSINEDEIIFVPDQNLGHYVSRFVPNKKIILSKGFCPTHHKIKLEDVAAARKSHPGVKILVHPECKPEIIDATDYAGSTGQIIEYVKHSSEKIFIIGTEVGILHALKKSCPDKKFYSLHSAMICPNMKKTTLESVLNSLENMENKIIVDGKISEGAKKSIERMLEIV